MAATHGQIAKMLVSKPPHAHAFARGCSDVVTRNDFTSLERMLPGMRFAVRKVGQDLWELTGVCDDGSTVTWNLGS